MWDILGLETSDRSLKRTSTSVPLSMKTLLDKSRLHLN